MGGRHFSKRKKMFFKAKIENDFLGGKNIMCFSAFYIKVTIWQSQSNLGHASENIKPKHL